MLIRKLFKVEMAHRLVSSYSKKCQSIHGHSYKIEIILEGEPTEVQDEMVLDFGEVKDKINKFMDAFDHSMVVSSKDVIAPDLIPIMDKLNMRYIVVPYNPTAEMMACHILKQVYELGIENIRKVIVHETATGYAEADARLGYRDVDLNKVYYSSATGFEPKQKGLL